MEYKYSYALLYKEETEDLQIVIPGTETARINCLCMNGYKPVGNLQTDLHRSVIIRLIRKEVKEDLSKAEHKLLKIISIAKDV